MMSRRSVLVLVSLAIILLSSLSTSCAQTYSNEDLGEAYQNGYNAGFAAGYTAGLDQAEVSQEESTETEAEAEEPIETAELDEKEPASTQPVSLPDEEEGDQDGKPSGAFHWYVAKNHIGEWITAYGTVVGTRWASTSNGKPTFLNVGKDYPSPDRFAIVIWIDNRGKFSQPPEDYYLGKTICVSGLVDTYQGVVQIEVQDPSQLEVR